jgi:hypothetical protein
MIQRSTTVPLHVINNRPFVDIMVTLPAENMYTTHGWLDTGGGAIIITEHLARQAGIIIGDNHYPLIPAPLPPLTLPDFPLDLTSLPTYIASGQQTIQGEEHVEVFLGGPLLGQYHLIFDYLHQQFTIADPDAITNPTGTPLPLDIHPQSKFPRIEVQIEGNSYGMLLDTGASWTMISQDIVNHWRHEHPAWQNNAHTLTTTGKPASEIYVPQLHLGSHLIKDVRMLSRKTGTFEHFLSQQMCGSVVGALGGNVLRQFRCEIDYVGGTLYLAQ